MLLELKNLDEITRKLMIDEINMDIKENNLYISDRLNTEGKLIYPKLLIESAESGTDEELAINLKSKNCFKLTCQRRKPKGGFSEAKVPSTAPQTLAEAEFNRFYVRALCLRVIQEKYGCLKVYRARFSENQREESKEKIGKIVDAEELLNDLRKNIGENAYIGNPNSGLSVEIV